MADGQGRICGQGDRRGAFGEEDEHGVFWHITGHSSSQHPKLEGFLPAHTEPGRIVQFDVLVDVFDDSNVEIANFIFSWHVLLKGR